MSTTSGTRQEQRTVTQEVRSTSTILADNNQVTNFQLDIQSEFVIFVLIQTCTVDEPAFQQFESQLERLGNAHRFRRRSVARLGIH